MMTDLGRLDGRRWRYRARRMLARCALVPLVAVPVVLHADVDGRAEWRRPGAEPARETGPRGNAPPVLGEIGAQDLVAGRPWVLHVRVRDPDGDVPGLGVRGLPDGARLIDEGGGWHRLDWTPPVRAMVDVDLTFVAVDARDPRIRSERVVRLAVRAPTLPASPAAPSAAESTVEPVAEPAAVRARAPRIEPLASQIVSAGRTVSFRVAATLEEERTPLLHIDRLPRNASFDANPDGSRTFYWPTGDREQGEHRFRITALHPDDARLRSRVDLLVIVGDPTRSVTRPLDEGGSASAGPPPATAPRPAATDAPAPDTPAPMPRDDVPVSSEDEPFLPRGGTGETDYWASDDGGMDGYQDDPYGMDGDPSYLEPDDPFFESPEAGYFDEGGSMLFGPDGQPIEP